MILAMDVIVYIIYIHIFIYIYICNAQSMEKHGLVVNTFIPTHNIVQRTNNRSC